MIRFALIPDQFLVERIDLNPDFDGLDFVHELVHKAYRDKLCLKVNNVPLNTRKNRSGPARRWNPISEGIEVLADGKGVRHTGTTPSWRSACLDMWVSSGTHILTFKIQANVSNWLFIGTPPGGGRWPYGLGPVRSASCAESPPEKGQSLIHRGGTSLRLGVASRSWKGYKDSTNGYIGHYHDSWSFGSYSGWGRCHNNKNSGYGT